MLNLRIIPCLLWNGEALVKTTRFKDAKYVGDAINAIRIFNEKEVDELIFLDITASHLSNRPDIELIKRIASECFMPLCYGGGIRTLKDIKDVVSAGVEKVSLNSIAVEKPLFVKQAAQAYGSSTIVACVDYKKNLFGRPVVTAMGGRHRSRYSPVEFSQLMEDMGAGEIVLNCIDRDGIMTGYDVDMLAIVAEKVSIPIIALGGAGAINHFEQAITKGKASAVAAGSMFVFHGKHKAVLINYPSGDSLNNLNKIYKNA
jgi:imidazole glycerol-phosphate synthase subunit HisF